MKKYIFFLLAALTFVACSEDESNPTVFDYGAKLGEDKEFYLEEGMQPMSVTDFQDVVVNHPWKCLESHLIMDDGSINEEDYYSETEGGGPYQFRLDKESLHYIVFTSSYYPPSYVEVANPYKYDENTNKVHSYPRLTLLSYDKENEQLTMIVHPSMNLYLLSKYQRMPEEWWTELCKSVVKQ